ncbi:serine/threonine-protein kinase ATM-like [Quercus robur]|uniref:serine/threonine-protein kinase ATM-like n=1 Tax=Quercus robur TaxID=38942 RepID=UPI0021626ED9|nr:serine/threonine-protein kinase ATM-like [Quercus robur]
MALPSQQLTNQPFNFGGYILELLYWTFVNIVTYFVSYSLLLVLKHLSLGRILLWELRENSVPSLGRADDRTIWFIRFTLIIFLWLNQQFLIMESPDFSHNEMLPLNVEILVSAVTQINEPDSLYGIIQSHKVDAALVLLGNIISYDLINAYVIPQDVWDLRLFKRRPSVNQYLSCNL